MSTKTYQLLDHALRTTSVKNSLALEQVHDSTSPEPRSKIKLDNWPIIRRVISMIVLGSIYVLDEMMLYCTLKSMHVRQNLPLQIFPSAQGGLRYIQDNYSTVDQYQQQRLNLSSVRPLKLRHHKLLLP